MAASAQSIARAGLVVGIPEGADATEVLDLGPDELGQAGSAVSTSTRRSISLLLVSGPRPRHIISPICAGAYARPPWTSTSSARRPDRGSPSTARRRPATTARSCPLTWSRRAGRGSGCSSRRAGRGSTGPTEHGGRGLTPEHTAAWTTECALAEVPPVDQHGRRRAHGRIDPRLRHRRSSSEPTCRGILEAEQVWCQLFSEPGAGQRPGQPLAAGPRPTATSWVVTGQKVWCSNGRVADRGILLARTDPDAPRHAGISFFLVDMHAPGIEVRPLRQMTGGSEFDEVFLDEVRLPADALLGPLHGGWGVAMATLTNERGHIGSAGHLPRPPPRRDRGHGRRRRRGRPGTGSPSSSPAAGRCRRWAAARARSRRSPRSLAKLGVTELHVRRRGPRGRPRADAESMLDGGAAGAAPRRARRPHRRRHHPGPEEHHRRAAPRPAEGASR